MSYTIEDIKAKASAYLGGNLRPGGEEVLTDLCECAAAELESRLRQGVDAEEISSVFVTASGILAIAMYMELDSLGADDVRSFKAGEMSASFGSHTSAKKLRSSAEQLLRAYLKSEGFEFMGVDG